MAKTLEDSIVLIVDDTSENIDILNDVLKNYKRKIATNGKLAIKIANSDSPPDIILLDIMMPDMDGYEVCRVLKHEEKTKNIPVIFITAMNEVEDETKGFEIGAVDFITKPISPSIVKARVKNQLELRMAQERLRAQNEILEDKNKYITDSINYAKHIQTSILPKKEYIESILPNHFLIFQPKDIVSGDFYWIHKRNNKVIIAQIDCTGHGVPGALMAMIGNTILNEIVIMNGETDSANILNQLDIRLLEELNKNINAGTKDGMDIALCVIDLANLQLQFSGAYRPIVYTKNNQLNEIKGDRKSIGDLSKINKKFQSTVINLEEDTMIYLFSDGIVDQNNIKNTKYGSKNLRNLLADIMNKNLNEQKDAILQSFLRHKGEEEQRDDVTFIGFSLSNNSNQKEKIELKYQNFFTYDFVLKIGDDLENQFSESIPRKTYKLLYFTVMELAQNIGYYSSEKESLSRKSNGKGELLIEGDEKQICVSSINIAANNTVDKLVNKLDNYNKLSRDELKKVFKTKLKSGRDDDSRGGGIGFIEIIKRTGNPLEYEINKIDETKSQIKLKAKLTLGENDG